MKVGPLPRHTTVDAPRILGMLFEGRSGSEIASACQVSVMSVTNVRKKFIVDAQRYGLMRAAQSQGIGKQVNDLMNLQKWVNGVGGSRVVEKGIEYGGSFEKIKVKPNEVSSWIEGVYEAARGEGLEGDEVGHLLYRFSNVVGESDLGYNETLEAMEEATKKRVEEEARSRELEVDIANHVQVKIKAETDTKAALDSKDLTQEKLAIYVGALSSLKGKVNIDDTVALSNLVKRLVQEKKPYEKILDFYERDLDLDREREEKTARNSDLDKSRQEIDDKVRDTSATLDANRGTIAVLDSWKDAGLNPERGTALMRKVIEYAALNGRSKEDALQMFYSDLEEHWEPALGFTNQYNMQSTKVKTVNSELSNTQELLKQTKRAYDSTTSAVEAKEALNKRGVGDDEIIAWGKTLSECGTDVHSFRDEMNKLGGIKANVKNMRTEELKAKDRLALLESKINAEKITLNSFRTANEAFREHFDSVVNPSLQNIKKKMDEVEAKMLDPETGIEPQMDKIVEKATGKFQDTIDTGVNNASNEMNILIGKVKDNEKDLKKGVDDSITKVDKAVTTWEGDRENTLKEFYELGQGVQRYKILADVLSVIRGEEPDTFKFTYSLVSLLDAVEDYYSKTMPTLRFEVSNLKSQLLKGLKDAQFSIG